jgi:hypothetical protein
MAFGMKCNNGKQALSCDESLVEFNCLYIMSSMLFLFLQVLKHWCQFGIVIYKEYKCTLKSRTYIVETVKQITLIAFENNKN